MGVGKTGATLESRGSYSSSARKVLATETDPPSVGSPDAAWRSPRSRWHSGLGNSLIHGCCVIFSSKGVGIGGWYGNDANQPPDHPSLVSFWFRF